MKNGLKYGHEKPNKMKEYAKSFHGIIDAISNKEGGHDLYQREHFFFTSFLNIVNPKIQ